MKDLKTTLMERDDMTAEEADEAIAAARENLAALIEEGNSEEAHEFMENEFGLEPDYLFDLF